MCKQLITLQGVPVPLGLVSSFHRKEKRDEREVMQFASKFPGGTSGKEPTCQCRK